MSLTKSHTPLLALEGLLAAHMPARFTVTADTAELADGSITLTPVTSPQPIYNAPLVGADRARMQVQVTIVDSTPSACRLAGDTVRDIITGTTRRGHLTTPIVAPGYTFDRPRTLSDGRGDTTSGIHTWRETYELVWQDRE